MVRNIRVLVDGATGRLGFNQHTRSILAIRQDGGVELANGDRVVPHPILLGRNGEKLAAIASANGNLEWSTDADACLSDAKNEIYFDANATAGRPSRAKRAIAAGKHIYLEKPIAPSVEDALELVRSATVRGVRNGVVQDKVFLAGPRKLRKLKQAGFFGDILSARLEFGWWVFDGFLSPAQRSSWNYRKADGGGLLLDMFPHWRYLVDSLVGNIRSVSCRKATRVPRRCDEKGRAYDVDVEDDVAATFELDGGAFVQVSNSWASRVKRDDLLTLQVDGTLGSAVMGVHRCFAQPLTATPKPAWNVDAAAHADFHSGWLEVPDTETSKNSYRCGWELFLRHVAEGTPFPSPLIEGAKGVQLVEACHRSSEERRWIDLPQLSA